jgi:UDP-N-acetylmuramate--alanine ligase
VLLVSNVYAAGEKPIAGADSERLVDAIRKEGHRDATWIADRTALAAALAVHARAGDVVITLGAGDITKTGPELVMLLRAREGATRA